MPPNGLFEHELFANGHDRIAAVDEVGRGALAGPLVAASVVVERTRWEQLELELLGAVRDSKLLSRAQREKVVPQIIGFVSAWSVVKCTARKIDTIGVGPANYFVLRQAAIKLSVIPSLVLIDGRPVKRFPFPSRAIIHGDREIFLIACASIIAKVARDQMMMRYHRRYPQYGFRDHVGYGTAEHLTALQTHGPCPIHRQSFAPVRNVIY